MKKGICSDCNQEKLIFAKQKCKRCYYREKRLLRQELAPRIKCQCSPNCKTMIPSINYDGKPMRIASDHGLKRELNPSYKGGFFIRVGYKWIYKPDHHFADKDGYVAEHRYVYEQTHKCSLLPWAIIHHKNEIKTDNRSENLEVWNRKQHQNIHNPRKGYRKDLSGRICIGCGSDKTGIQKATGQPHWCLHPITKEEWVCQNCYRRLVRSVRKPIRRIEERVCVRCGTNKSESRLGYLTWSKTVDGITCKSCYDKSRRPRTNLNVI